MALLQEKDKVKVRTLFSEMVNPVNLINFTQDLECHFCRETRSILEEVEELSENLSLEVYNFQSDKDKAKKYKIDKIPATVIEGTKDFGIRFYGVPSGYEFTSLLQGIMHVSKEDSELSGDTRQKLKDISKEVHLQVYVTPTCPYCPSAVILAHSMAMENDLITADMVEATEFPHLSQKYDVKGIPRTIINEDNFVEGAVPEAKLLEKILDALK